MTENMREPISPEVRGRFPHRPAALSTVSAILVGSVFAVAAGWLGWIMVALCLVQFGGIDDAAVLLGEMRSQAMMFRLLPATFAVVLAAILLAGRFFRSGPWWVALGVSALTALSITPPFAFLPSIHGNYLPMAAAALVGALLLRRQMRTIAHGDDRRRVSP